MWDRAFRRGAIAELTRLVVSPAPNAAARRHCASVVFTRCQSLDSNGTWVAAVANLSHTGCTGNPGSTGCRSAGNTRCPSSDSRASGCRNSAGCGFSSCHDPTANANRATSYRHTAHGSRAADRSHPADRNHPAERERAADCGLAPADCGLAACRRASASSNFAAKWKRTAGVRRIEWR